MSHIIRFREGRAKDIAKALEERFGLDYIEFDLVLRKWRHRDVYDVCQICNNPICCGDEYTSQGYLTSERLVHKRCLETAAIAKAEGVRE